MSVGLDLSEDYGKGLQRETGVDIALLSQPSVDIVASSAWGERKLVADRLSWTSERARDCLLLVKALCRLLTIYLFNNGNNNFKKPLKLYIWSQCEQGSDARIFSMTLFILSLCTISGHTADTKPNVQLEL